MGKIIYKCAKCGWTTSIRSEWGDLKPKRCMGKIQAKKCNTSFLNEPKALLIEQPTQPAPAKKVDAKSVEKEKDNGKRSLHPTETQN